MLENLPHLQNLDLRNMESLEYLAECNDVTGSTKKPLSQSLRSLYLNRMERLEKWIDGSPNSSTMLSPVLEKLVIINCPKIRVLDECYPHPLVFLQIVNCPGLEYISLCDSLLGVTDLPNQCHSLKTLEITKCGKLPSLPLKMFDCFIFLNTLKLGPFSQELESFPSLQGIDKLRNHLHSLQLTGWDQLKSIPEEIQHLISLTELTIWGFGIQEVPMWLTNMSSIRKMLFRHCFKLDAETFKQGAPQEASYVELNQKV